MPKVSIITPCYNGSAYLAQTIQSVQAQTLADWEYVIVDDGSTDSSAQVAEGFANSDPRIRVVQQANRGVNSARNAGLRAASPDSPYLLFLDADDLLHERMLETLTQTLDRHAAASMALCGFARINAQGEPIDHPRAGLPRLTCVQGQLAKLPAGPGRVPFDTAFWWIDLPPATALMRRSAYERLPGWDETLGQGCEDTDMLLRFFLAGDVLAVPDTLASYRQHAAQATRRGWFMKRQRGVLHDKWLRGVGLTSEQRVSFAQQWRLYEGRLLPSYLLGQAAQCLARRDGLRSLKFVLRAAAHALIFISAPCRRLLWPSLWYFA